MAWEGIGLTQVTELTQFPSETSLVSDGNAERALGAFGRAGTWILMTEEEWEVEMEVEEEAEEEL